ncbi:MAG: hypothetical protein FWE37_01105 [Spirochaetaceae bacterium]|nr:hypothetical protein [Spirochaetaceae bacterium]
MFKYLLGSLLFVMAPLSWGQNNINISALQQRLEGPLSLEERSALNHQLAISHELAGNLKEAQLAYQQAYFYSRPVNHLLALRAGFLAIELGELSVAIAIINQLARMPLNNNERNRALSLTFTIYGLQGNATAGTRLLQNENNFIGNHADAALLFAIYRYHIRLRQINEAMPLVVRIQTLFPNSPEAALLRGTALVFPSPANVF